MNVVLAISEIEGLVKTGGLADVGRALALQLAEHDHTVSVFMPYYQAISALKELSELEHIEIEEPLFSQSQVYQFNLKVTEWKGVKLYLVDYPEFFDREGLYSDRYHAYDDNGERFSFFSGAVLHSLIHLKIHADIIHCHDWHTAVLPFLLKHNPAECFANTKSIITVHNAAFQGVVQLETVPFLRHHPAILSQVHGGYINMLKMGLAFADKITTVSPNYARELLTHLGSHGLDEVLLHRQADLIGILNGCDYSAWDPSNDTYLEHHYSIDDLAGKKLCKRHLQSCFDLPEDDTTPLLGMVCRLTNQKGFGYLLPILPELLRHKVQLVIAGTGDPSVCMELNTLAEQFPKQFAFFNGFSDEMAHKIEAGADFFLMPSQFEPCGLNQMYSLAYGTLPIVRAVGGLRDTVIDIHESDTQSTGVVFHDPTSEALLACLRRALLFYHESPDIYTEVQTRGMLTRFTWQEATGKYERLYQQMVQPA
jgi:starch synthase